MKQTLTEIFKEIGNHSGIDAGCNDKNSIHTYLETYDRLFEPYRYECSFLEIGLALGDSINLWDKYFVNSYIYGVDISIVFDTNISRHNWVTIFQADAAKKEFIENVNVKNAKYDIVIDDGSHMTQDQIDTFNLLKHQMNEGGLYILEDILALDQEREKYLALHDNCEIIDMRDSGRFDNVLIIYKF